MAQVTDTRNGASPSGTAKPARRIGAAGLSPLDHEQAAAFSEAYATRPSAPVAVVIAAYNEEKSVGGVVTAVPKELCGLATEVIVVVDGARDARPPPPGAPAPLSATSRSTAARVPRCASATTWPGNAVPTSS